MMQETKERTLFSWIHVSDIHFLHGSRKLQVDQEMVLQALVKDIVTVTGSNSMKIPKPDGLFITGDVVFSGGENNSNEYQFVKNWLQNIANSSDILKENVFIVPGNHDVQRNCFVVDDDVSLLIENLRDGRRDLEWALSRKTQFERLVSRFENYLSFASDFAPSNPSNNDASLKLFWYHTIHLTPAISVNLLGLNTAILSQDDEDKGKLRLSLEQLKSVPDLEDGTNVLVIALGHHPFSWLADGDDVERWLRKKAHIYLSGHIHDVESFSYISGGGTGIVTVQSGALHSRSGSPHSYNYASIIKKPSGQVVLRISTRSWSEKNKDFREDTEYSFPGKQYAEYELSIDLLDTGSQRKISISPVGEGVAIPVKVKGKTGEYITDSPPVADVWVGRRQELDLLGRMSAGVIAITGIGGQGKSVLASKYLENWKKANLNEFWDWRDCREQREQFHTKLISIIEHFTLGSVTGKTLEGAAISELVRIFIDCIKDEHGLIVLDNMDHYVNVHTMNFTLGVSELVETALQFSHHFKIIITCRPRINYPSPRFQEIRLEGISVTETRELFRLRRAQFENRDPIAEAKRIHELTDGHPLWLNLIATQVASNLTSFEEIIGDLEQGKVDDRAKIMLRSIWRGLNRRQEVILRHMTELSRPEDVEWIHECVKVEIKSWNQFRRTFESLKSLSLIVEARGKLNQKEFDLHPIIRNYIKAGYFSIKEREPFLNRIIWMVKTFINKYGKSISVFSPINLFEYWVLEAELEIQKGDFKAAIKTLIDVGEKLTLRGMPGELFRVGDILMNQLEDEHEKYIDLNEFHELNRLIAKTYAEYGRVKEAKDHSERYRRMVPKDTAQYISVCDVHCYVEWLFGNFEEAIRWGQEGVTLKEISHIDTKHDSSYNLALSQRDSGRVDKALEYFLDGETIEEILRQNVDDTEREANFFGNIGRCLQFNGRLQEALRCFVKSALLLEKKEDEVSIMNRGYAALWIGEVLENQDDYNSAYMFYRRAELIWAQRAPVKVKEPQDRIQKLSDRVNDLSFFKVTESGINRAFKLWIEDFEKR